MPVAKHLSLDGVGVAIDFETSGTDPSFACAVGLTRIEHGRVSGSFETLLRPPSSRVLFTEVHGLTWSNLRSAPSFTDMWDEIARFAAGADFFIAHNASFDRRVLNACLCRACLPLNDLPFLCTLKGARKVLKKLPSRSLAALCQYFCLPLNHHNAGSDANACAEIFLRLKNMGVTFEQMRLR
ncbi:MAG: 3'-5' exoribonuclease [Desulfovibrio sp.]|nr:3'-5' exoribonuclease [Desulfovibrio sp.]